MTLTQDTCEFTAYAELVGHVSALLSVRHDDALLPAVLTVLHDHLHPDGPQASTAVRVVDVALVQQLGRLLGRHTPLAGLLDLLAAVELHLAQPGRQIVALPDIPPEHPDQLSARELQVLRGMARGMANGRIAQELFLSEDTVKTHARRMFKKVGARDRAHAVARGYQLGLLVLPGTTRVGAA